MARSDSDTGDNQLIALALSQLNVRKPLPWIVLALVAYTAVGFWLVPFVAKKQLPAIIDADYGLTATVGEIKFNPWSLTLEVTDFQLNDPDEMPLMDFERLFINLQTSSIINWAVTLKELSLTKPEIHVLRYSFDDTNLQRAADAAPYVPTDEEVAADSAPIRLLINEINLIAGSIEFEDRLQSKPFVTTIGPVDVTVNDLNTLPDRSGQQQVSIVTETGASVSWTGSLDLAPLVSAGSLDIQGPLLPIAYRYLEDQLNFEVVGGDVSLALDYKVLTTTDGDFSVAADNIELEIGNAEAFDGSTGEQLLNLPALIVSQASLRYPEQTITADAVAINDLHISSWLGRDGAINYSELISDPETKAEAIELEEEVIEELSTATDESTESSEIPPWALSIGEFRLNRMSARFEDRSLRNTAQLGIANMDFVIRDISNGQNAMLPFEADITLLTGGQLRWDGNITVVPDIVLDSNLSVQALDIAGAQAYASEVARISIDSGAIDMTASIKSDQDDMLAVRGSLNLNNLAIQDLIKNEPLLNWNKLVIDDLAIGLDANNLEVSRILIDQPYARLIIAKDGSTNFSELMVESENAGAAKPEASAATPMQIQIGETDIRNGDLSFTDLSLPLLFTADIENLEGDFSTISTTSTEPTQLDLQGTIDEFGTARINGSAYVLDPTTNADINVTFLNLNMPTLSPYTAEFVGQKIATGKLAIELGYQFDDGNMLGSNSVVITDFTLGDKVENEDAMRLPLGLAVALLKDKDGVIDVDLEVSGDVDDPEFSMSGIVLKALGNLIAKVASSPFRALGGLVGGDDIDLDLLQFEPGRSELTPPDREKLLKLADALAQRPELLLVIPAVLNPDADKLAMQTDAVDARIDAQMSAGTGRDESPDMFIKRQRKILEKLYKQAVPDVSIRELRKEYTRVLVEGERAKLDAVAYSAELRRRLIGIEPISNTQLEQLAAARAFASREQLLINDPSLSDRVRESGLVVVGGENPEWIELKMTIEVIENTGEDEASLATR